MNAISPNMDALAADMGIPMSDVTIRHDKLLLGLRDEFRAAVTAMAKVNCENGVSDEVLEATANRFNAACWAIAVAPPAQTLAGRALKAAAAKQQLRGEFCLEVPDSWPDRSHELVWNILTEIAGDEYFPAVPAPWEPPGRAGVAGEVRP